MRTKGKLSYIRLLIPVLLFAGVQMFAQAAADSGTPASGPNQMTSPHADVFVISDRNFLMKSIAKILHESGRPSCSSSTGSVGFAEFFLGSCAFIDCAAPPPGCFYQNPTRDHNGCLTGCGTLVCDPNADR